MNLTVISIAPTTPPFLYKKFFELKNLWRMNKKLPANIDFNGFFLTAGLGYLLISCKIIY